MISPKVMTVKTSCHNNTKHTIFIRECILTPACFTYNAPATCITDMDILVEKGFLHHCQNDSCFRGGRYCSDSWLSIGKDQTTQVQIVYIT